MTAIILAVGALLCAVSFGTHARAAEKVHRIGVLEALGLSMPPALLRQADYIVQ